MQEYSFGNLSPDPGVYMSWLKCDEIPSQANNWKGQNDPRWCNPEYDALSDLAEHELNPKKRQELFIKMNDMLIRDVALIPLVVMTDVHGISSDLEGVEITPWDCATWRIAKWRRK